MAPTPPPEAPLAHEETTHICGACGAESLGGWPPCDVFTTTLLGHLNAARAKAVRIETGERLSLTAAERELLGSPAFAALRELEGRPQPPHLDPPRDGYPTPEWVRHNLDHAHAPHRAHAERHRDAAGV